ncbi:hypothetical protein, partial [Niastella vici]|uniref:hypothetical protein n=1 Tax=Niastella vici TaxID=1703345 RepID=UPI001C1FDB54
MLLCLTAPLFLQAQHLGNNNKRLDSLHKARSASSVLRVSTIVYNVTGGGTYCTGGSGMPVGLDGSEAGGSYQLQLNGVDIGAPIAGTGSALSFGNQTAAGTYTVVGTVAGVSATMAGNVAIAINDVTPGVIATNQTICSGGDPAAFTIATAATGSGTLSYQWQSSTNDCSTGFTDISGATSATYDVPGGLATTTYYRRIATSTLNGVPCTATSNCVTVTINNISAGSINSDQTICNGGDPNVFTSTDATGLGTISYQWQSSTTNCTTGFADISGATSATYDVPAALAATTYYRRIATSTLNGVPCSATSNCVTVTVNAVTAGTIGSDQTICNGGDPAAFTITTAATGSGSITYQWQSSTTDCTNGFANISGATGATYDIPGGLATTTYYRRIATSTLNGVPCSATSNCVTVTINNATAGTIGSDQTICSGSDPSAFTSVVATGSGTISYQWQSSTTNCT